MYVHTYSMYVSMYVCRCIYVRTYLRAYTIHIDVQLFLGISVCRYARMYVTDKKMNCQHYHCWKSHAQDSDYIM